MRSKKGHSTANPELPPGATENPRRKWGVHFRLILVLLFMVLLVMFLVVPHESFLILSTPQREDDKPKQLFTAHLRARESCKQWIAAQRVTKSYMDAYIIGTQKGATSELTKRLHRLGVRRGGLDMVKEWWFLNTLSANGRRTKFETSTLPFTASNLHEIRAMHYRAGKKSGEMEMVDNSDIENRTITYDGSVEYSHSDRTAFLAHLLTPHAKVVLTLREPIERAISQYNMLRRIRNAGLRKKVAPNKREFHEAVVNEMKALKECGYDPARGNSRVRTSELGACTLEKVLTGHFLVMRGLYHLHIESWLEYFPRHRMLFIRFTDMLNADEDMFRNLSKFLCIRQFPRELIEKFREKSSAGISFGQQELAYGSSNETDVDFSGKNRYLGEIREDTRRLLDDFYRVANRRLVEMLGVQVY